MFEYDLQQWEAAAVYKVPLRTIYSKLEIPQEDGDPNEYVEKVNENEDYRC